MACEELGLDTVLFAEHSHVPQGPAVRRPSGRPGGRAYVETYDGIVATAVALSATGRLRAGPGVAVLAQRDPISFAKAIASLDVLSDGRVRVGVGAGWNELELRNHNVAFADRYPVFQSRLELVLGLLARDPKVLDALPAVGAGIRDVAGIFGPSPVQRPCPPFLVGGESRAAVAAAARHGLGWLPSCVDPGRLLERIREVRDGALGDAARALRITVYGPPVDDAVLSELVGLGVDGFVFRLEGEARNLLEELEAVAARALPCRA